MAGMRRELTSQNEDVRLPVPQCEEGRVNREMTNDIALTMRNVPETSAGRLSNSGKPPTAQPTPSRWGDSISNAGNWTAHFAGATIHR
jgi:hypothetical protein